MFFVDIIVISESSFESTFNTVTV